ncbi:o-succinylbenzoate synthase [Prevotella histicola]|uniref:o-succinylbenzoate synthase n=1 Tax=Prevotella histicola TaxID=470565 RepID=UPI001C5ED4CC|nr:o-succinylbenzoate synthase [Prevotella histicola]MBW4777109.1 o-succinylbenzoate synthase [Prevotella histicola]
MYQFKLSSHTLHFIQPAGTSRGVYTTRQSYYVTLSDDNVPGSVGIGECATLPDLSCDAMPPKEYERILKGFCDDLCQFGKIDKEAMRPYPSMLFGLETAKRQLDNGGGIDLFNTPFGKGEEGITINGLIWMGTFDEMFQRLEAKLKAGFHCVKLKIGAIDFEKELRLIQHIRQHFSRKEVELRVDANGGFTPDDAMQRLEALAKYDIHSIEQPIRQHQWKEMARLCKNSPLPIALDEELIGVNDLTEKNRLLDTIQPQYIILKPSLHGGISGTREWIKLAKERGIGSWMTSALESNIGLNAIAQLTADIYGPHITMAQGLGTGQLFSDNIPMPLEIRGEQLWVNNTNRNI